MSFKITRAQPRLLLGGKILTRKRSEFGKITGDKFTFTK